MCHVTLKHFHLFVYYIILRNMHRFMASEILKSEFRSKEGGRKGRISNGGEEEEK